MKRIKPALQILEHIVLIALVAGSIGFYLGNHYGQNHVSVKSLSSQNTPSPTLSK